MIGSVEISHAEELGKFRIRSRNRKSLTMWDFGICPFEGYEFGMWQYSPWPSHCAIPQYPRNTAS
jgi:hypothetical protein